MNGRHVAGSPLPVEAAACRSLLSHLLSSAVRKDNESDGEPTAGFAATSEVIVTGEDKDDDEDDEYEEDEAGEASSQPWTGDRPAADTVVRPRSSRAVASFLRLGGPDAPAAAWERFARVAERRVITCGPRTTDVEEQGDSVETIAFN